MTTAALISFPAQLEEKLLKMHERQFARLVTAPEQHTSQSELYWTACTLKRAGFTNPEIESAIRARFAGYYRPLEPREIENAILHADESSGPRVPRWPLRNPEEIKKITARCSGALDLLRQRSSTKNPRTLSTGDVLDRLFKPTDLLCLGQGGHTAFTEPRSVFYGAEAEYPLIVPNPMSARVGTTKDGRSSTRCLSNVGPRVHAVIEFDWGTLDEQAAIHIHLSSFGVPLRMVVFSGKKSLHGWFDVRNLDEENLGKFLRYAAYVGADTATFSPIQFVRMPNAVRPETQSQQTVEHLS